jgi:DNA-binding XRE family transcriptional regulator
VRTVRNVYPLKQYREARGVRADWLAQQLKLNRVTYSRYENGKTNPPPSFWFHLAYIFREEPKGKQSGPKKRDRPERHVVKT